MVNIVVVVRGERELPHLIDALCSPSRFAGGLDCGQKQGDEHADDGDDNEKFDERKAAAPKVF